MVRIVGRGVLLREDRVRFFFLDLFHSLPLFWVARPFSIFAGQRDQKKTPHSSHLGAALLVKVDAGLLDGADLFEELLCG